MLLVDVVKKKIYLHLKHLHLSCVRSRQFSPEHIKYRNRKPADLLTGLDSPALSPINNWREYLLVCWVVEVEVGDMRVLMMLVCPSVPVSQCSPALLVPPGGRDMVAARRVFAVRGPACPARLESVSSDQSLGD